jgi:hypothetical protein
MTVSPAETTSMMKGVTFQTSASATHASALLGLLRPPNQSPSPAELIIQYTNPYCGSYM